MAVSASNLYALAGRSWLEGKVALITGGAMGIGEAIARLFCKHGAKVVTADIQDDRGRAVCQDIGRDVASYVHCDVSVEDDVGLAVDHAVERFGKLDIVCNNAVIIDPLRRRITDNQVGDFERVLAVNVTGVFLGTKHAARVMVPAGAGSIINMGSAGSVVGGLATHAYVAAKHAVVGLTRNAAAEMGQHGVRVNCLSPFLCTSKTAGGFFKMGDREMESWQCELANLKGTVLTAEDIAQAAVYLASDEAKYVSGQHLVVDGGFTAVNTAFGLFKQN